MKRGPNSVTASVKVLQVTSGQGVAVAGVVSGRGGICRLAVAVAGGGSGRG